MSDSPSPATFVAPAPADLAPLFPGYDIGSLIATGGMGAVYQAVQKSLDRTVAIKILPHEFSADAAFCAGFEAEAKAMARLNHPNLIGVYDFGEVAGMLYIIMEYVPGGSLFHSSHGTAIDPAETIRIVTGICSGLAHAHDNGIIHRDIKPANILLDLNANPKIGDFGLARPADRQIQEGEEIFGTPHYTAPEVANSPHSVDHRSDIFSVGVILHELLTGCLPEDDHRPASAISHCDPRFDAIIRRATDPLPENRYSSAHEIERELHIIATSSGPKVLKTAARVAPRGIKRPGGFNSSGGTKYLPSRQSSGSPVLVFLLIAALAAVAGYFIFSRNKQPPAETAPETNFPAVPQPWDSKEPPTDTTQEPPAPVEPKPVIEDSTSGKSSEPEANPTIEVPSFTVEDSIWALPKFDVAAFLERARKIMRERATPVIDSRNRRLGENLARFEQDANLCVRKTTSRGERDAALASLDDLIKGCKRDQNRIPSNLPGSLDNIRGMEEIHEDYDEMQTAIDLDAMRLLAPFSSTYTLGIEKQILRLQGENDPAAIKALEEEIKKTRDENSHFPNLMFAPETDEEEME